MAKNIYPEKKEAGNWEPKKNSWTSKLVGNVVMVEKDQQEDYKTIKKWEIWNKYGLIIEK